MKFLAKMGLMAAEIVIAYVVSFICLIAGFWVFGRALDKDSVGKDKNIETTDEAVTEEVEAEPVQDGEIVHEDK